MSSLHKQFSTLPFKHKFELHRIANHFIGLRGVEYFELSIINPEGVYVSVSVDPTLILGLVKKGFCEGILNAFSLIPLYDELTIWKNSRYVNDIFLDELTYLTREKMGITDGLTLIRRWDNFNIFYSFATSKNNKKFSDNIETNVDFFLRLGDFAYNEFRETYADYAGGYTPPKISRFHHYNCSKPCIERYSPSFLKKLCSENKVIEVDFLGKKLLNQI